MTDTNISIPQESIKMKTCTKCEVKKIYNDFYYDVSRNGYRSHCKDCVKKCRNKYYDTCEGKISKIINNARKRCRRDYLHKGIKMMLTEDEISYLWNRDSANLMKRPSLDRIDSNGDYVLYNCRFIELSENSRLGAYRPVLQKSLEGKELRKWRCIKDAAESVGVNPKSIWKALSGVRTHCKGYKWEYTDK